MILFHNRHNKQPAYTEGVLTIRDSVFALLLEDPVRDLRTAADKVYGETAIPAGRYEVIVNESKRFKKEMPLLLGVPFFEGIRAHSGEDVSDTLGCPLMGSNRPTPGTLSGGLVLGLTDRLVTFLKKNPGPHYWVITE